MTREEFKAVVKKIRGYYQYCPITTQSIFDDWYEKVKDMEYAVVVKNLDRHTLKSKVCPTVADLRNGMPKGFNNFAGRTYDMRKLELAMLGIKEVKGIKEIT